MNARASNTKIAKAIGLSKDAVAYRIRNLENKGVIRGYIAVIDSAKLGYTFYRVFLNLMDLTPEKLEGLIGFLKKEKNVWWIAKLDGAWNFAFSVWVKSNTEFREFYSRFCEGFKQHVKDRLVCPVTAYKQLNRSYLLGTEKAPRIESIGGGKQLAYDETDIEILKMLSKNARFQLIDIAKRLKMDSMTIHHRIRKMEEKGIIQGYKADLNFNLLKKDFYSVKVNVREISQLREIESFVKTIPEATAIIEAVGSYDFEFDLEVENSERYFEIIGTLEKKFSTIREIIYFRVLKNYKVLYMPEA